ncbi:unnamed protein product [Brassica rapa]|uniref:Uncharacterized protein n=1 Tax=Brassica campestris TaxID=3711 RepID=A0A3P6AHL9_BRACM|nr:unnamed protein product [Brassica rapa]VDC88799.1 unnamed protein product [Brassica rapa]
MPLWRETSVELSSLRSKGLHPCLYFSYLQFIFSILLHFHVGPQYESFSTLIARQKTRVVILHPPCYLRSMLILHKAKKSICSCSVYAGK